MRYVNNQSLTKREWPIQAIHFLGVTFRERCLIADARVLPVWNSGWSIPGLSFANWSAIRKVVPPAITAAGSSVLHSLVNGRKVPGFKIS